jgi:alpha-tubulin suppressor-like RCC1 family protein
MRRRKSPSRREEAEKKSPRRGFTTRESSNEVLEPKRKQTRKWPTLRFHGTSHEGASCQGDNEDLHEMSRTRAIHMDGMDQVRKVAAGSLHSAVVTVDGSGWTAGSNEAHALGNRRCEDVVVAPAIPMPGDPQQSRFSKVVLPGKAFDVVDGDGFSVWLFGEFSVSLFSLQHPQSSPRTLTRHTP